MRVPVPWVFVLGYLAGVGLQLSVFPRVILSVRTTHVIFICGAVLFAIGAIIAGWGPVLFHKACTTTTPAKLQKRC